MSAIEDEAEVTPGVEQARQVAKVHSATNPGKGGGSGGDRSESLEDSAAHQEPGWSDTQVETAMGNLLRVGVLVAAAVVIAGGVLFLLHRGTNPAQYGQFRGEPADLRSVRGIVADSFTLSGRGLIQLGLLLLVATPVARVIFSVVAFLRERDFTYVLITLLVLGVLAYSLFGGHW